MHRKGFYRGKSEYEIAAELGCEGLTPRRIEELPGSRYELHMHADDVVMAFLAGSAEITIGDRQYSCSAGDRLVIDGEVGHSALVGPAGCVYLMTPVPTYAD
jgi:hypothetical protein